MVMDRQRGPETVVGGTDRAVRAAVASVPFLSVLLVDTQMRYQAVLGSAARMHGYDPASLLGRRVAEVLEPSAFARIGPLLQRALGGETVVDVAESVDGLAVYETTYAPAVEDGVGIGALAVVRDVTMEHRALAELAAGEEQHQMILGNISDVIAWTRPDGRISWVSGSVERVLGWRPDQLLEHPIFEFVHPGDVDELRARRAALLDGGGSMLVAYRFARPDGTWIPIESHVRAVRASEGDAITGLLVTARDVTERRRLESELAQATEMFEQSFAAAPIGKALVGVDGRFIKVNTALCLLLGRDAAELIGLTFRRSPILMISPPTSNCCTRPLSGPGPATASRSATCAPTGPWDGSCWRCRSCAATVGIRAFSSSSSRTSASARTRCGRWSAGSRRMHSPACPTGSC